MEANKLREFEEKCRKHDWTYDWSEDSVTWDKGAAERTELNKLFDAFEGIDRLDAIRILEHLCAGSDAAAISEIDLSERKDNGSDSH